ncbi:MAG: hypothetical protein VX278_05795, partial [Myxococcota bacterium]|nr:hypothetical protein [Myxococcota bacterium]
MRSVTSKSISLSVPIWISVFAFATVHETTLIAMTLLLVILSIWILRHHQKKLPDLLFLSMIC